MARYIVFDVETPNRYNNRISAIGISVVENAKIIKEYFYFVNPGQRFDWFNTQLTGISAELVADAPTFPQLWKVIEPVMSSGMKPQVRGLCTVVMGRRLCPGISHRLNDLCDYYGICLNHHHADSDSRACAEILLRYMEMGAEPEKFVRVYNMW